MRFFQEKNFPLYRRCDANSSFPCLAPPAELDYISHVPQLGESFNWRKEGCHCRIDANITHSSRCQRRPADVAITSSSPTIPSSPCPPQKIQDGAMHVDFASRPPPLLQPGLQDTRPIPTTPVRSVFIISERQKPHRFPEARIRYGEFPNPTRWGLKGCNRGGGILPDTSTEGVGF